MFVQLFNHSLQVKYENKVSSFKNLLWNRSAQAVILNFHPSKVLAINCMWKQEVHGLHHSSEKYFLQIHKPEKSYEDNAGC